jgi:hypothetical protein
MCARSERHRRRCPTPAARCHRTETLAYRIQRAGNSLPLNCFLPHKTRMDAGFARSVHSVLPSFIPSNNDGYCWRGRWTQFERQLRQRINRQRTTQTKLHFTLPSYSPVVIRSLPISSAATTFSKIRGGQAVHINHPRHSAPASCAGCFGQ